MLGAYLLTKEALSRVDRSGHQLLRCKRGYRRGSQGAPGVVDGDKIEVAVMLMRSSVSIFLLFLLAIAGAWSDPTPVGEGLPA